jgi:hypothetical protein
MKTIILTFLFLLSLNSYIIGENVNYIVKANITLTNNNVYSGYFISSFPISFKFNDIETLEFLKTSKRDSVFLQEYKVISDGTYIFKFSDSYYTKQRFGVNEINSLKIVKFIIDPQPPQSTSIKLEDFKIFKNQFNKIHFVSGSKYNPNLPINFTFISFANDSILNYFINKTENYIKESAKNSNMSELIKNIELLIKECKLNNIIVLKGMEDINYFKFDNAFNTNHNLDYKTLNDF